MCDHFPKILGQIWRDEASPMLKVKVVLMGLTLLTFNFGILAILFLFSLAYPYYLSDGLLAYTLGLRHAVDADHIAAIDNVTRKLVADGKQPVAVGLWFSLGHSTVVFILGVALAFGSQTVSDSLGYLQEYGGIVGASVSATFLFFIGFINLLALIGIYKAWRALRQGTEITRESLDDILARKGFLSQIFGWIVKRVDRSWKMYPLGLLFGLGFDTASEIALLGISVIAADKGFPPALVVVLPLLFVAGMSLVDTADGVMMIWAYGWADLHPSTNLFYNMTVTLAGVLVAFVIGTIEVLQLLSEQLHLDGWFFDLINGLDFEALGFIIIGIFLWSFGVSYLYYKWHSFDEVKPDATSMEEGKGQGEGIELEEIELEKMGDKNEQEKERETEEKGKED